MKDCPVCRFEGFQKRSRNELRHREGAVLATRYQVGHGFLTPDEAGLSEAAWHRLEVDDGDLAAASHPHASLSLSSVRTRRCGRCGIADQ